MLETADLDAAIPKRECKEIIGKIDLQLAQLQRDLRPSGSPILVVLEGWDAGGKGGAIRRLTRLLDPRGYEVNPVAAPQGEEKTHHYLWRFWRALPKAGHVALFDRSWYGRVLVERVEGFASAQEWQRAYREINEFESQLLESGAVVLKFSLHISKGEQLSRFQLRAQQPHKQWKITDEDWRNREKWEDYWGPVSDMLEQTSTPQAPWIIIEGNDKRYARLKVLETVAQRLSVAHEGKPLRMPQPAETVKKPVKKKRTPAQPAAVRQAS